MITSGVLLGKISLLFWLQGVIITVRHLAFEAGALAPQQLRLGMLSSSAVRKDRILRVVMVWTTAIVARTTRIVHLVRWHCMYDARKGTRLDRLDGF